MPYAGLGTLMTKVPAPLAIGTLELEGGGTVTGFLCESIATEGAKDISSFGGYRAYATQG
jgi:allophanate hydrolase